MTRAIPLVSPADQKVTFVELFFDLVFVFSVTQVAGMFQGRVGLPSAVSAVLVFWLVWWAWTQFTWALNAANTDHPRVQVITLLATAMAFFLAVGVPQALGARSLWFAVPYVVVRVIGLLLYYWVAWGDPIQRRAVRIFGLASTTGLVAVLAGSLIGGAGLYLLWGLAIALDLLAAAVGGQLEGWNLHPEHFVERHGLIVIIALGETLIAAAAGLLGAPRTPLVVATAVLAVAVVGALWWTYFPYVRPVLEHALAARDGNARSCLARDAFSVMHFPMLCGVIAVAVAIEEALLHPEVPLGVGMRIALAVGVILFECGAAAAIWRATGQLLLWRGALALGAGAVAMVVGAAPWIAFAITFTTLVAVVVVETGSLRMTEHGEAG